MPKIITLRVVSDLPNHILMDLIETCLRKQGDPRILQVEVTGVKKEEAP